MFKSGPFSEGTAAALYFQGIKELLNIRRYTLPDAASQDAEVEWLNPVSVCVSDSRR